MDTSNKDDEEYLSKQPFLDKSSEDSYQPNEIKYDELDLTPLASNNPYNPTVELKIQDNEANNNNNNYDYEDKKQSVISIPKEEILRRLSQPAVVVTGWRRYLGMIYTVLAVNLFSIITSIMKKYSHIHPFNVSFFSSPASILMSLLFLIYAKCKGTSIMKGVLPLKDNKRNIFLLWLRSVFSTMISYLTIYSFKFVTAADLRTVVSSSVIAVYFFGWCCLGESCGIIPVVVAMIAVCGIGIMTKPPMLTGAEIDDQLLIGIGLCVLCMLVVSFNLIIIRALSHIHHGVTNLVVYLWGMAQAGILAVIFGKFEVPPLEETLVLCSSGVALSFAMAFLVLALQNEEAGVVALIRTSEVLFVFVWQLIVVGTLPDIYSIVGAILVLTGVTAVTLRKWLVSLPPENSTRKKFNFLLK